MAKGRGKPLWNPLSVAPEIHGDSGMDGPVLPEPSMPVCREPAAALMARLVEESPEPVALIVTGPCTNTAVFLLSYPHLWKKIAKISVMGGGAFEGNRTALAEFNIWTDPEAARIVLESGIPVEIYGLDVTHKALMPFSGNGREWFSSSWRICWTFSEVHIWKQENFRALPCTTAVR